MNKIKLLLIYLLVFPMMISCKDENEEPDTTTSGVSQNIIGTWLLSSSDANNWAVYEFTETARLNVETSQNGNFLTGYGFYSVDEKNATVSGNYSNERGQFGIDWIIKSNRAFQIDFEQYNSQIYAGEASINRVVATIDVNAGCSFTPKYRDYTGQPNCSGFSSLDSGILTVDATSGKITGINEGSTYITFDAKNGRAAIKVNVTKIKTLQELIVGVWIYDNRDEHEWQRTEFLEGGTMSVEWGLDNIDEIAGMGTGKYTVSDGKVNFTVKTPDGTQFPQEWRIEMINDYDCTYDCYSGTSFNGKYTGHRLMGTINMSPGESNLPDYHSLFGDLTIKGFKSHNNTIATVDNAGTITAKSKGRTYIEILTDRGSGVIEVTVGGGAIPYEFQDCLGKPASKVKEMLGAPFYEDETTILYKNLTNTIDMVGARIDSFSGLIKGITITYNSNVKTDDVTSILDATFIPFASQTTATFKAYMDTDERADASIGVTWDIPTKTLTYVNLATDLFTDYSVLINMTRDQVISKMGKDPDSANDQSQNFFFFDNKGIKIVSAYYTDFVNNYDKVHSVVTMFDDTLSVEQITTYLKKKYPYYPEYSTDEELVFVPEGHAMEIYYRPKDKMIMYISTAKSSDSPAGHMTKAAAVANQLKANMRTE